MSDTIRRERGGLEQLVLEVCKRIDNGGIATDPEKAWTPHRLAAEVLAAFPGAGANPSTGAISDTLKRWEGYGFAEVAHSPLAFIGFTDAAREKGLQALKDETRAARPPRAPKAQALAPSGTVTLEVNPGQEDTAAEMAPSVPTPAEALEQAEEATAEGEVEVIHQPDGGVVIYDDVDLDRDLAEADAEHAAGTTTHLHDDAEYAQGDPHPTAQDDVQSGWTPRDEWDDLASTSTETDEPEQGEAPTAGQFSEVRSIDVDQEDSDGPASDDDEPFAPVQNDRHPFDQN